jgi:CSLREA domain-containing protein
MPSIFSHRIRRSGLATLFVLAAFAAIPAFADAVTVTVNTTADNAPAPGQCEGVAGDCSLRQAIDVANGEPGSNRVIVPGRALRPDHRTDGDRRQRQR